MKNIVFLESAQNLGGARIAAIQMAKNLETEHNVMIVDFYGSCKPFVEECNKNNLDLTILSEGNPYYIKSATNAVRKYLNLLFFIPHLLKMNNKLNLILDRKKIDYVCVSSFRPLLCMFLKRRNVKIIFFAHGWYNKKILSKKDKFLLKHMAYRIVCISEATKQALYNNNVATLDKLLVLHNSIDENSISENVAEIPSSQDCFKILHCGGFTAGKGQHVSLDIARELKLRGFMFKMIFTGIIYQGKESEYYYKYLRNLVKQYEIEENVIFIVNKNNVYDYIRACDVLIHPSETEGFPLALMEAQILKKPIIANAVGGVIDLVLDGFTGFLPSHNNVNEYVEKIIRLKNDEQLYNFISDNAYSLAKKCFNNEMQKEFLYKLFI